MIKEASIVIDGVEYPVIIEYKGIKNAYFKYKDGTFYITSTYFATKGHLLKTLKEFAPRLLKRKQEKEIPYDKEKNYIYIFGEKREYTFPDDERKLEKDLKKMLLIYLNERVSYFKEIMGISHHYNIKVRKMNSRFGSNSRKTMSLCFNLSLVHYSFEIIDSVIIHELAHDKVFNHSKAFYNEIYKYCPNYKLLKRKLNRGIYS